MIGTARGVVADGVGCHAHVVASGGIGDKEDSGDGTWQVRQALRNDSQFTYQI